MLKEQSRAIIPTPYHHSFVMVAFAEDDQEKMPHLAIMHPDVDGSQPVVVRIHSECMTGDVFHSMRCDCGEQLDTSLSIISKERGIVLYLRQEGRGIGLIEKLKAYQLQDKGYDTVQANLELGHGVDTRDFSIAATMLKSLKVGKVRLLTNNPEKVKGLEEGGIEITERLPLIIESNKFNESYLLTKKNELGHKL